MTTFGHLIPVLKQQLLSEGKAALPHCLLYPLAPLLGVYKSSFWLGHPQKSFGMNVDSSCV